MTELWKRVWREGFQPSMSTKGLEALRDALDRDDARLIQGATTSVPVYTMATLDWPIEAACPVGFCGWQGNNKRTIADVEEWFALECAGCDQRLGEPAACRHFLNWWDETPREEARRELLTEVRLELLKRYAREQAPAQTCALCHNRPTVESSRFCGECLYPC